MKPSSVAATLFGLVCWPLLLPGAQRTTQTPAFPFANTLHVHSEQSLADAQLAPFPNPYHVQAGPESHRVQATVGNCAEYLALPPEDITTGSTLDDRTLVIRGARCVTLEWMRRARATVHSRPAQPFSFHSLSVRQLPPEFYLAVAPEEFEALHKASAAGQSILDFDSGVKLRVANATTATLSDSSFTELLELYAYGDILGNGSEQWVVLANARVQGGSYTSIHLYMLTPKGNGYVVVRSYPSDGAP